MRGNFRQAVSARNRIAEKKALRREEGKGRKADEQDHNAQQGKRFERLRKGRRAQQEPCERKRRHDGEEIDGNVDGEDGRARDRRIGVKRRGMSRTGTASAAKAARR